MNRVLVEGVRLLHVMGWKKSHHFENLSVMDMTVGFENVVIVTVVGVSFCLICMCLLGSYCLGIYYSICVNECRTPKVDDG